MCIREFNAWQPYPAAAAYNSSCDGEFNGNLIPQLQFTTARVTVSLTATLSRRRSL